MLVGGYTTGRADVIAILRQKARPYLFSNTLAPSVVGAGLAAFDLLESDPSLVSNLRERTRYFRAEVMKAGFESRPGWTPIVVSIATPSKHLLLKHSLIVKTDFDINLCM